MHTTITTFSGRTWDYDDPRPENVDVVDLAHHLGNICRFTGATKVHYSVAQHSIMVAGLARDRAPLPEVKQKYIMYGLLHDASEAYLGDVPTPWKNTIGMEYYKDIETRTMKAIGEALGFDLSNMPDEVHEADKEAFYREQAYLMNPPYHPDNPFVDSNAPWSVLPPTMASQAWLYLYESTKKSLDGPQIILAR